MPTLLDRDTRFFVPPMLLTSLIHYAENQHWDYLAWFKDVPLELEYIKKSQGFIEFSQLCHVIENALSDTQMPNLGLWLGHREALVSMGILGFAMQSCKTVTEALHTAIQYHPITGSVLNLNVHIDSNYCSIELTERSPCHELIAFFCDEVFASIITCLDLMIECRNDLIQLKLSYDHSDYLQDYQRIFNCPVQFNYHKNIIQFNSALLTRPLKNYSPANYQTAIQICEQALKQFDQMNQHSLVNVLQHLIENHLPKRFDMQQAAQHFHLSERHLRRLLLNEGLNFQLLRQQILEKKAKQWIEDNHSISEVSFNLGFSELREFRRAFKKWTGHSPTEYKKTRLLGSVL